MNLLWISPRGFFFIIDIFTNECELITDHCHLSFSIDAGDWWFDILTESGWKPVEVWQ